MLEDSEGGGGLARRFQGSGREVLLGHFEGVGLRSWPNGMTSCITRGQGIRGISKLFFECFLVFFQIGTGLNLSTLETKQIAARSRITL